jgi:hypothetical protein
MKRNPIETNASLEIKSLEALSYNQELEEKKTEGSLFS